MIAMSVTITTCLVTSPQETLVYEGVCRLWTPRLIML